MEIWNDGFEPVIDARVNPEIVAFTGATPGRRYRWAVGPGKEQNDWWKIARISPGDLSQRKSLVELAKHWQTQLIDKQKSGTTLIKYQQRAAIIFRITYHREVDKRQFSLTKIITIDEVPSQPGNKLMYMNVDVWNWSQSSPTERLFLEQLDRLSKVP